MTTVTIFRGPLAPAASGQPRAGRTTPERLRLMMAVAVLASLLLGGLGLLIGYTQAGLLGNVERRTTDVVSLLSARADLTTADATVTNAFLIGGLEPGELRSQYESALVTGSQELANLAGSMADPDDSLVPATGSLTTYSGLVEQARANNRQGLPVGVAYLDQASNVLADQVTPALDAAVADSANESAGDFNTVRGTIPLALLLVLLLGVLALIQMRLSASTRRTLNPPMLTGSIIAAAALAVGLMMFGSASATANDVRLGDYRATLAVSQALSLAGEARSAEAFTLIQRGNGASYEEAYQEAITQATADLERAAGATGSGTDLKDLLAAWDTGHQSIRALDDDGDWDGAVALAVSDAEDAPGAAYRTFVTAADADISERATAALEDLGSAGTLAMIAGWVLAVAGVACAVLSWRGLSQRLEEYR